MTLSLDRLRPPVVTALPTSGLTNGDTYVLSTDGITYTWSGIAWLPSLDPLSPPCIDAAGHSWGAGYQLTDQRYNFLNRMARGIPVNNACISGGQAFGASYFGGAARVLQDPRFRPEVTTVGPYQSVGGLKVYIGGYNDGTIFGLTGSGIVAAEHGIIAQLACLRAARYIHASAMTRTGAWSLLADTGVSMGTGLYYTTTATDFIEFTTDSLYNGEGITLLFPSINGTGALWTMKLNPATTNIAILDANGVSTYDQAADDTALLGAGGFAVTGVASTDIFTATAHGYVLDQPIVFSAMTGGAGLVAGTTYYARTITANTFQVAAAPGGAAVNFTTDLTAGRVTGSNQRSSGGLGGFRIPKGTIPAGAQTIRCTVTSIAGGSQIYGIMTGAIIDGDAPTLVPLMPHRDTSQHIDAQMTWSNARNTAAALGFHNITFVDLNEWMSPNFSGGADAAADQRYWFASTDTHPSKKGHGRMMEGISEAAPMAMRVSGVGDMSTPVSIPSSTAYKTPVRAATTANITLSGLQTIDTVVLAAYDRVLVKDQTVQTANGVYYAQGGAWERVPDSEVIGGTQLKVSEGDQNGDTTWAVATNGPIVLGTTNLAWTQTTPSLVPGTVRHAWNITGVKSILESGRRGDFSGELLLVSGKIYCVGGLILPANRRVSGLSNWMSVAGTVPTARWVALLDAALKVLAVSTNSGTTHGTGARTDQAFASAYTPPVDTPVYRAFGLVYTTGPTSQATPAPANAARMITFMGQAPIEAGTSSTAASTVPPTVGNTLGPLTAIAQVPWCALYDV